MEINCKEPWMAAGEIEKIKSYLNKSKIFFEWGAGGSTLEFSKYVKEYYSVEHDFEWYQVVSKKIGKNVKLYYVPPHTPDLKWDPYYKRGSYEDFNKYINFADNIACFGKKFDAVLIDGRSRAECAFAVLEHLSENAIVFMHDFNRPYYWDVLKYYDLADIGDKMAVLKKKKIKFNQDRLMLAEKFLLADFKK